MARTKSLEEYKKIRKHLTSGSLARVYVLSGEEVFFHDRLQEQFEKQLPEDQRDFNLDVLYGRDCTADQVIGICRSYPMMAELRCVIIRDFMQLFENTSTDDRQGEGNSAEAIEQMAAYIANPNPTTLFVAIDQKKPAGNTKLGKTVKQSEHAVHAHFDPVEEHQLPAWITEWNELHYRQSFEEEAVQLLAHHVGSNLLQLSTEVDKLCTYKKTDEPITPSDVRSIVGLSREYTVFELTDAMVERDLEKSMSISEQMLLQTDQTVGEVIKTLGFFYSMFSKVWQIQRLSQKGLSAEQIRSKIGVDKTYYFKRLSAAARQFRQDEMHEIFESLLDADQAVKGYSNMNPGAILLLTVRKIVA